ncbi:glutamine--fructose-6-phosphate transaminase (isomerizing) [Helicobacter mustelae]|uniref:Glutamine--fructose-6-phosphate aminotransferase [isomerizing] n=1 Tax=Helicobacter mustelae (strain ATCC 43772 / CCUG 25715 / CIP 103759 / LMG 18044 / NCTC 12198 / R85-136P) TaxID=679897 RepID=D3UJL6_HELM1|nr:glutamine--fructose-6-phosphate transaminase (isomerizing) [Helicobacter mustelae]CBG40693.1 glucosamine--fructose-6-phosphate aminotransferase (isomerizing) [Helicobacter mustelae 12198]SQH72191.1 glucosamine--fructose-6-phosphate aminotransferase [Helicobacter mustelae]STP13334.1 glucosamine--fructose-6-phosphate aminotransferase [Helicobacter mustelae]
MCGIVGYIGKNEIKEILIHGLKELEYRGYDSAGIAVLDNQKELHTFKAVGKIQNLENKVKDFHTQGFGIGIGHTRWATHGKPTEANAHPHIAAFSNVVHNGIIENYADLKKMLEQKGCRFISQTDTEVIVHLFEENLKIHSEPMDAFAATIQACRGAYAILLITKAAPSKIFYAKHSSPLIIGRGEHGIYFSSSDSPLVGLATEVVYLEDGAIGVMQEGAFDSLSPIQPLNINKNLAQKDGFRYFMEKEIYEQHNILLETIMGRTSTEEIHLEGLDPLLLSSLKSIHICACGTSYHSAMVGKYLIERLAQIRVNVAIASEFRYANPVMEKEELFISISQSGETADTLEALKLAKKSGLKTLAICNVDNSSIVRESESSILTRAGIEKGVASTKAFASQVLVLWLFGVFLAQERKKLDKAQIKEQITRMFDSIKATQVDPDLHERIKRLSKRYLHGHGFFFIGRDVFYPLALEGALKLKEISYLHAEGYPGGEMKHGPIALADSNLFTIALMPEHLLYEKIKSNVEELSARDTTICSISSQVCSVADDRIVIPQAKSYMEEFFSMTVVLQILALEIAIKLGNDVDMPRNLAKSVTVE